MNTVEQSLCDVCFWRTKAPDSPALVKILATIIKVIIIPSLPKSSGANRRAKIMFETNTIDNERSCPITVQIVPDINFLLVLI